MSNFAIATTTLDEESLEFAWALLEGGGAQGLPGYTYERAPGESWCSRFDAGRNLIVVNSGHRDFVFATRQRSLKLRYLVRLYAKEMVLRNFVGLPAGNRQPS